MAAATTCGRPSLARSVASEDGKTSGDNGKDGQNCFFFERTVKASAFPNFY
jgi:hypothetical protein